MLQPCLGEESLHLLIVFFPLCLQSRLHCRINGSLLLLLATASRILSALLWRQRLLARFGSISGIIICANRARFPGILTLDIIISTGRRVGGILHLCAFCRCCLRGLIRRVGGKRYGHWELGLRWESWTKTGQEEAACTAPSREGSR